MVATCVSTLPVLKHHDGLEPGSETTVIGRILKLVF